MSILLRAILIALTVLSALDHVVAAPTTTNKQFSTANGTTYTYDFVQARNNQATVLLLHGFPSTHQDWHHQIRALSGAGYGVIAPDMLGFGDSDRPTNVEAFRSKTLTADLAALLDAEDLDTVVGVGHDYGSDVLSKMYFYHPARFSKLAFLSVGYSPAGYRLDIDAINAASLAASGYTQFGYWYFMNSYDAGPVIAENLEAFYSIVYTPDVASWIPNFAQIGGLRKSLTSGTSIGPLACWDSQEHKDHWMRQFSRADAVESAVNIYRRIMRGANAADEAGLDPTKNTIEVPVLVIGGSEDKVTPPEMAVNGTTMFARAGLQAVVVEAGHWVQMEKADEVNSALLDFIQ